MWVMPIQSRLATLVPLIHIVVVPPIWWFLHAFGVLETADRGMVVLLPLTGGRRAYNPSHLVSC